MEFDTETWKERIAEEMESHGDSWENVVDGTATEEELLASGYLGFTIWTEQRVYFPIWISGCDMCASVARHPDDKPAVAFGN